ncbi:hypothetical protein CQW23_24055 [Capsicum baccatum]|uniref:Uncharacterized protein n=1 Tax=Capsicum baccatum TaxID=33114 RepID=A0A2G2VTP8_CAPBA|nr:hypothetical protein CQW23_24055 [Capsicum baccatum]
MSNSELFQVKEEGEKKKSSDDIQLPTSNNPDRCVDIAPGQHGNVDRKQDENNLDHDDYDDIRKKDIFQGNCSEDQTDKGRSWSRYEIGTVHRRSTQALHEDDTHKSRNYPDDDPDDDGFTTPTSSDHKIPVMTTCPPAPKKSIKRRFSASPNMHPTLQVDFESIIQEEDLGGNNKKLRKNDHQE